MARLTEGCEVFIASLEKAQAELEFISNQLEEEFSTRYKHSDINPLDIISRIHKIKQDLPALANECAEVLQAKQECSDAAKHYLLGNAELLNKIQRKSGIERTQKDEETLKAFKGAVQELESKLMLGGGEHLSRSALNEAIVQSTIVS